MTGVQTCALPISLAIIALVGIPHLAHRMVHTLSDGERQKVMIAKALAQETPVIYLDEPTAFLDFPSKVEMMQLLHQLSRRCFGLCGGYRERNAARNHGAVDIRQLRHYGSCRLYTASVPQRDGTRVLRDECRARKSLRRMVRPADGDVMPGVGE